MTTSIITNNSKYFLSDWIALDYTVPGSIVLGTGNVGSVSKSNSGNVSLTGNSNSVAIGFYSSVKLSNSLVGNYTNFSLNSPSKNISVQISGIASSISTSVEPNSILIRLGSVVGGGNVGLTSYSSVVSSIIGNSSNVSNSSVINTPTVPLVNTQDYCDNSYTSVDYAAGYITSGITSIGSITSYSINLSLSNVTGSASANSFAFGILPLNGNSSICSVGTVLASSSFNIAGNTGSGSIGNEPNNTTLLLSGIQVYSFVSSLTKSTTVGIAGNIGSCSIGNELNNTILAISGNYTNSSIGSIASSITLSSSSNTVTGTVGNSLPYNTHGTLGNSSTNLVGNPVPSFVLPLLGNISSTSIGNEPNNTILAISGNSTSSYTGNVVVFSGISSTVSLGNLVPGISHSITGNTTTTSIGNLVVVTNAISIISIGSTGTLLPKISNPIYSVIGNVYTNSLVIPIEKPIYGNQISVSNGNIGLTSSNSISGNTGSVSIGNEPNNHVLSCSSIGGLSSLGNTSTSITSNITSIIGSVGTGILSASVTQFIDGVEISYTNVDSIRYSTSSNIQSNELSVYFSDITISSSNSISGNLGTFGIGVEYDTHTLPLTNVVSYADINSTYSNVTIELSRLPSSICQVGKFASNYVDVGLSYTNSTILLSDIQSYSIHSIRLDRIYAQSGLIIQERSNEIVGNTGTISYGNEQTEHRELLTSTSGNSSTGIVGHDNSVHTPGVEETVSGLSGNCSSNISIGISGNLSSIYQSYVVGSVTNPNVTTSVYGVLSNTNIGNLYNNHIRSITGTSSTAQSGLIIQERSNGIVGNTGTISYGNEPTVVSKNLTSVAINANVGNISSDASHVIPKVEETAHILVGNIRSNVSVSLSGTSNNTNIGSLSSNNAVRVNKVESIFSAGNIPSISISSFATGMDNTIAIGIVLPTVERSVSLSGNELQTSINNINAIFYSKPIVGIISNSSVGKLKVLPGNIRLVSVGLVRFVRTGVQDIEFSETINRNIRYR